MELFWPFSFLVLKWSCTLTWSFREAFSLRKIKKENKKINFPFLDLHFPLFLTGGVITQIAGNIVL